MADFTYSLYKVRTHSRVSTELLRSVPAYHDSPDRRLLHRALDAFLDNDQLEDFVLRRLEDKFEYLNLPF